MLKKDYELCNCLTVDQKSHLPEERGEVSDREAGIPEQDSHQQISKDQNYRETVTGVTSYMGFHQELESSASFQDDNPFAGSRSQPTGKISVKLLSHDWLCWKLEKQLNIERWLP